MHGQLVISEAMEEWTEAVEFGYDIDIIYTDCVKAFESLPHKRLAVQLGSSIDVLYIPR